MDMNGSDVRGHISIHAPAKGATAAFSEFPRCSADFNPRSREGSDILTARKDEHCFHFNPRSREGSDETAPFHTAAQLVFQSTLPRRERPDNTSVPRIHPHHFNPRSREGATLYFCICVLLIQISIHAPAKGATSEADEAVKLSHISIHAPAKGATRTVPHSGG